MNKHKEMTKQAVQTTSNKDAHSEEDNEDDAREDGYKVEIMRCYCTLIRD
jgi:hypothetical protein